MRNSASETDPPMWDSQVQLFNKQRCTPCHLARMHPLEKGIPSSTADDVIIAMTAPLVATEMLMPGINSVTSR